jgi:hypothetical protein
VTSKDPELQLWTVTMRDGVVHKIKAKYIWGPRSDWWSESRGVLTFSDGNQTTALLAADQVLSAFPEPIPAETPTPSEAGG